MNALRIALQVALVLTSLLLVPLVGVLIPTIYNVRDPEFIGTLRMEVAV